MKLLETASIIKQRNELSIVRNYIRNNLSSRIGYGVNSILFIDYIDYLGDYNPPTKDKLIKYESYLKELASKYKVKLC